MDEPSVGLAPTIVDQVIGSCHTLAKEGVAILLVEQNLGAATATAIAGASSARSPRKTSSPTPLHNSATSV